MPQTWLHITTVHFGIVTAVPFRDQDYRYYGASKKPPPSKVNVGTEFLQVFTTPRKAIVIKVPRKKGDTYRIRESTNGASEKDVTEKQLENMVNDMKPYRTEYQQLSNLTNEN